MAATQAAENHRDELGLPHTFDEGDIHQFQPESSHKIHKDILPWKISQMITKTIPISTRTVIIISNALKQGFLLGI